MNNQGAYLYCMNFVQDFPRLLPHAVLLWGGAPCITFSLQRYAYCLGFILERRKDMPLMGYCMLLSHRGLIFLFSALWLCSIPLGFYEIVGNMRIRGHLQSFGCQDFWGFLLCKTSSTLLMKRTQYCERKNSKWVFVYAARCCGRYTRQEYITEDHSSSPQKKEWSRHRLQPFSSLFSLATHRPLPQEKSSAFITNPPLHLHHHLERLRRYPQP